MAELSGQNHGSAGSANRVRAEAVFEQHAALGKRVDMWSRVYVFQPAVVGADSVGCVVIAKNKNDVVS